MAIRGDGFFSSENPMGTLCILVQEIWQKMWMKYHKSIWLFNGSTNSIPKNTTQLTIDPEGRVFANVNNSLPREIGQILLARFNNPDGLKK